MIFPNGGGRHRPPPRFISERSAFLPMRRTTLPRLRALVLALALLCALTLPAFADDGKTAPPASTPAPPTPTVSAVKIDPPTPAALDVGKNLTLTASVFLFILTSFSSIMFVGEYYG